jgi:hypothetical protein
MTEWFRIDDPENPPPMDGSVVLLYGGGSISAPAIYYMKEWRFWDGQVIDDCMGDPAGGFNSWLAGHGPTHWMPLPEPPQ